MKKKIIIIGGVAGGASAAARIRRLDENAEIIMFERDNYISFANCGLPYYIGETIKERNKLLVQTPEAMNARFNLDVRINSEVTGIDTKNKKVTVKNKELGTYDEAFDYLILSPGAKPIKPGITGIDSKKIFTLRNIPDTDRIKNHVDTEEIKSAVVVGGGFIGIEMAENLKERGLNVTLVEAAPHILAPLDSDMAVLAEKELSDNEVNLILNDKIVGFNETEKEITTTLGSGKTVTSHMVVMAIGVIPDTGFLQNSGIALGTKGHILVDEHMATNIEGIYAVGDAVEIKDFVTGQNTMIPLAGPANKQGRIAADNIAGLKTVYKGTQGTSILKVFNLTAASTGLNERNLKTKNIVYKTITIHPQSHASYYPGASPMTLKLIFNEDGTILGSQIVGYDGVDKRVDVIATTMRLKGTVHDLAELELAYAPPFSSAKDPVNMAGYVAANVLNGSMEIISAEDALDVDTNKTILLDVRTEDEFDNGNVEGSINIPVDNIRERLSELDKDKEILLYCQVGLRGYIASRILYQNGFKVKNIIGGYKSISALKFKPADELNFKALNKSEASNKLETSNKSEEVNVLKDSTIKFDRALDACGLCCPGPLMQVKNCMDDLKENQILKVTASDPGFYEDIKAWCKRTNNELLALKKDGNNILALIKRGSTNVSEISAAPAGPVKDNKTMVVFSGDLDKAIASFIIANGAASMGKKVTMFFTFWGLNILRKHEKVKTQKGLIDKMFGIMMPRGSQKLKLSNMNMMGMGATMIRTVMKNKNISSLEDLIKAAIDSGVEIVACQMSMDVMGLRQEELIDGIKIGGVGYYLGEAEDANVNLFI